VTGGSSHEERLRLATSFVGPDEAAKLTDAIRNGCPSAAKGALDHLTYSVVVIPGSSSGADAKVLLRLGLDSGATTGVEATVQCGKQVLERMVRDRSRIIPAGAAQQ
jgi:hypothetical protein